MQDKDLLPWKEILVDTKHFTVYKDGFPVTEGHVLFVPKQENWKGLTICFEAAYKWGYDWVERGYCDAFNIGHQYGQECRTNLHVSTCTFNF